MVARVCLVSGGTGGHLMPALVLGRALHARGHEPVLVTEGREVERELLRREPLAVRELQLPGGRPSALALPVWLLRAVVAARRLLREQSVGCVVSTGGRPSVPMGLAARSLGLPVFLLEQNAVTGRANRWLAPFAARVYHGLPNPAGYGRRGVLTGTPLRAEFAAIDRRAAREALRLDARPVVLVTGGSQGASVLNQMVPAALLATGVPLQVLHLAGLGNDDTVRRAYAADGSERVRAYVRPVAADMDRLYGAADLVVCRGGGTTVAELAAVGRPAVIVPYPHHKDRQQWHNAQVLGRAGGALVVEERDLTLAGLTAQLGALLRDPERLAAMGECAARQHPGDPVATILADLEPALAGIQPVPQEARP
jgi:UDP-N-acetylglucosamine--N-acetylmuramyl-(pentapeptide) pyrophosphoryl-undecaprenol N-acetylglucosamine transferase